MGRAHVRRTNILRVFRCRSPLTQTRLGATTGAFIHIFHTRSAAAQASSVASRGVAELLMRSWLMR